MVQNPQLEVGILLGDYGGWDTIRNRLMIVNQLVNMLNFQFNLIMLY